MKPKLPLFLKPSGVDERRIYARLKSDIESIYERPDKYFTATDKYLSEKILGQPGVLPMEEKVFTTPMMPMMPMVPPTHLLNYKNAWVLPPIAAAPYEPPPPVERKPKAERKAVRRRNRKKGHR